MTREYKHVDGVVQTSDISENGTYSDLVWGEGAAIRVQSGNYREQDVSQRVTTSDSAHEEANSGGNVGPVGPEWYISETSHDEVVDKTTRQTKGSYDPFTYDLQVAVTGDHQEHHRIDNTHDDPDPIDPDIYHHYYQRKAHDKVTHTTADGTAGHIHDLTDQYWYNNDTTGRNETDQDFFDGKPPPPQDAPPAKSKSPTSFGSLVFDVADAVASVAVNKLEQNPAVRAIGFSWAWRQLLKCLRKTALLHPTRGASRLGRMATRLYPVRIRGKRYHCGERYSRSASGQWGRKNAIVRQNTQGR